MIRNDCYELGKNVLKLPFGHEIKWKGDNRWSGKQGRLEISYDRVKDAWYAHQPVEVESERSSREGKNAYVDLGVMCFITAKLEGEPETVAFSGKPMLSDWWYWTHRISQHKSELERKNGRRTSKRLKNLYRKRARRFRHRVNTIIKRFVEFCHENGVSKIVAGELRGILGDEEFSRKSNSMVHNFWSFRYVTRRLEEKAEEFGMEVELIDERGTSSRCPRCESEEVIKRGRLFKCKDCRLEAHRDAVGALNISAVYNGGREHSNGLVAQPSYQPVVDA